MPDLMFIALFVRRAVQLWDRRGEDKTGFIGV
jgi:hypothetical protein